MNAHMQCSRGRRFWSVWTIFALVGLTAALGSHQALAADAVRVEEDWQLVVGEPDVLENSPQVTCAISPLDMETSYCAFDINYRTLPEYAAGGMQLHTWTPTEPMQYANSSRTATLATTNEQVTWTTRMWLTGGRLYFSVRNGNSQTWGAFGGTSDTLATSYGCTLSNLNQYSPDVSVAHSGVSFAKNRVSSLKLISVRWYDATGNLIKQDNNSKSAYPVN